MQPQEKIQPEVVNYTEEQPPTFDLLVDELRARAKECNVDEEDLDTALGLVDKLRSCEDGDYTAVHSLMVGMFAADFADATGADKGEAMLAGMLHDVGKSLIDRETLLRSVFGGFQFKPGEYDIFEMGKHAYLSAEQAIQAGFSAKIVYAIAQHHAHQTKNVVDNHAKLLREYPELFEDGKPPMGVDELTAALIDADFTHAALSRLGNTFTDSGKVEDVLSKNVRNNFFFVHQSLNLKEPNNSAYRSVAIAVLDARKMFNNYQLTIDPVFAGEEFVEI